MTTQREYVKHLITCRCILPHFESMEDPPIHKFIVFSELDDRAMVVPSYAQCNNCGIIHRIKEVGLSECLKKDSAPVPTINEIKTNLPEKLVSLLETYDHIDLSTYQEIDWIFKEQQFGRSVILSKETIDGTLIGKNITIFSESSWRINQFSREEQIATNDE